MLCNPGYAVDAVDFHMQRSGAPPTVCDIWFQVYYSSEALCESIVVVGNEAALGAWDPATSKVQLSTSIGSGSLWQGCCSFPPGAAVEFKFAALKGDGAVRWEDGIPNRKVLTQPGTLVLQACFDCESIVEKEGGDVNLGATQVALSCNSSTRGNEDCAPTTVSTLQENGVRATACTLSPPHSDDGIPSQDRRNPETEVEPVPNLPEKRSITSMTTDVPGPEQVSPGLAFVGQFGFLQSKASDALNGMKSIACDKKVQVATVSAVGGAAVLGTGGGAAGLVTGSAIGAAVGVIPALFTFGLSIPVLAAVGGGCGLATGTAVGGTVGLLGGGAAGFRFCAKQGAGVDTCGR
mmetsp:Transcript_102177/g.256122  ORF Transcript_102177/g.256122 Transcript_102177/m.256122 type:complete len:350 (-) Transcript_102177:203-1252(-)